nr:hypothetical transcript [Hymenolepis microstoma]
MRKIQLSLLPNEETSQDKQNSEEEIPKFSDFVTCSQLFRRRELFPKGRSGHRIINIIKRFRSYGFFKFFD